MFLYNPNSSPIWNIGHERVIIYIRILTSMMTIVGLLTDQAAIFATKNFGNTQAESVSTSSSVYFKFACECVPSSLHA